MMPGGAGSPALGNPIPRLTPVVWLGMAVAMVVFGVGPTAASDHLSPQPSFVVHRQLEAEVSKVEPGVGLLRLKTEAGRLKVDAPAAVTAGLRKGDRVLVDVTVIRQLHPDQVARPQPSGQPMLAQQLPAEIVTLQRSVDVVPVRTRAGSLNLSLTPAATHPDQVARPQPSGQPMLAQQLPAEIVSIQRSVDVVTVKTRGGSLNLRLPSAAIAGLRTGEQLPLEFTIHLMPEASALPATDRQRGDRSLKALFFAIFGRNK